MIVTAKPLPINRRLGDVIVANASDAFSVMQLALFGLGAYFFWNAIKRAQGR